MRARHAIITPLEMPKKRHKLRRERLPEEGTYTCPSCGEQIVTPLDSSAGIHQEYVEDCPVCCSPNVIHVEVLAENEPPRVWAEAE